MDHLHPGARARFSFRLDLSLVPRKVTGPAARANAFPSGAGCWWQMSLALVPRKVKPSELDEDDWCWDPDAFARWNLVMSYLGLVSKAGRPCAEANAKHLGAQVSCGTKNG